MDGRTARLLNELSQAFYAERAQEFSDTRQSGWPGWQRCWKRLRDASATPREIIDVACGNLRFETWAQQQPEPPLTHFIAIDSCNALLPDDIPEDVTFVERDIIGSLLNDAVASDIPPTDPAAALAADPAAALAIPTFATVSCDAATCFGFMHHVPGTAARARLLNALLVSVKLGGLVAISFWRFADDDKMRAKAERTTKAARAHYPYLDLGANDYLLGFNDSTSTAPRQSPTTFRYCHSFTTAEIDDLLAAATLPHRVIDRWRADGRTGALNEYVVLQRA